MKGTKNRSAQNGRLHDLMAALGRLASRKPAAPRVLPPEVEAIMRAPSADLQEWIQQVERHAEAMMGAVKGQPAASDELKFKMALMLSVFLNELRRSTGLPVIRRDRKRDARGLLRHPDQQPPAGSQKVGLAELLKDGPIGGVSYRCPHVGCEVIGPHDHGEHGPHGPGKAAT